MSHYACMRPIATKKTTKLNKFDKAYISVFIDFATDLKDFIIEQKCFNFKNENKDYSKLEV